MYPLIYCPGYHKSKLGLTPLYTQISIADFLTWYQLNNYDLIE